MHRRQRLSRSRDFDAVYRHGRSVSTRYLTLHWFARADASDALPRLGLAVPKSVGNAVVRNRIKRLLRVIWEDASSRAMPGRDYVIVARPGIAEPAEARGQGWLADEVAAVIGKASA